MQVPYYVQRLLSPGGAEKDNAVVSICNILLQHFIPSRKSEFINTKSRYSILDVLVNIFLIILIRSRRA